MKNVETKVEGDILTIKVDLSKNQGLSSSGKNELVATTSGNQELPGAPGVKIGLNIFRKPASS